MRTFLITRRLAVRAPRGAGKTTLSAIIVLWAVTCLDTDVKVITTASAWRQLVHYTWPEIHKWVHAGDWEKLGVQIREGVELTSLHLRLGDRRAFAAASDDPQSIEGAHATITIVVFDEAKAIASKVWDALEGTFSVGTAYAFAISTPGVPSGRFYDIHKRKRGYEDWEVRHVTLSECVGAGRFLQSWADARLAQWGAESSAYQNYVLANFSESSEDVVIPLSWIEAANERWEACAGMGEGRESWGCDPGYKGNDPTAIAKLVGTVIEEVSTYPKQDLMATVGRLTSRVDKLTPIGVDTIGIGAGVYSRLLELGFTPKPVVVSEKTELRDTTGQNKFFNLRSYVWWSLREALDPELGFKLALPPIDELTGDLATPTWAYTSNGTIKVESKQDIRARLDRSTDYADAVGIAWYVAAHRGLSLDAIERWGENKIRKESLSEGILKMLRESGVDVDKELD